MLDATRKIPQRVRRILDEMRQATVIYAPTKAGVSAAIFDRFPYLRRVTVEEAGRHKVRIVAELPWWSWFGFGLLHRRVYREIAASLQALLPVGIKVDLRVL